MFNSKLSFIQEYYSNKFKNITKYQNFFKINIKEYY